MPVGMTHEQVKKRYGETLRKKEKLFVLAYTDRTKPKTYQNATQSAIKAGYKERRADVTGSEVTKRQRVIDEIAKKELENDRVRTVTLEQKVRIAWGHYLEFVESKNFSMAKHWFREHGELQADYIHKTEITDKTDYSDQEQEEIDTLTHRFKDN